MTLPSSLETPLNDDPSGGRVLQPPYHQKHRYSPGFPVDNCFYHWSLGFTQSSLHQRSQPLRNRVGRFAWLAATRFSPRLCVPLWFPAKVRGMDWGVPWSLTPLSLWEKFTHAVKRRT
jgi:hypothetical protein